MMVSCAACGVGEECVAGKCARGCGRAYLLHVLVGGDSKSFTGGDKTANDKQSCDKQPMQCATNKGIWSAWCPEDTMAEHSLAQSGFSIARSRLHLEEVGGCCADCDWNLKRAAALG